MNKQLSTILFLILFINSTFAQTVHFSEITIKETGHTVKAGLGGRTLKKVKSDVTYYWYQSNKINTTKGGFDGRLLHGTYTENYETGELKQKGQFEHGLKNGSWKSWKLNGNLIEENAWNEGKLHGLQTTFDNDGIIVESKQYKKGLLHGTHTIYVNGKESKTVKYNKGKVIPDKIVPKQKIEKTLAKPETEVTEPIKK